MLPFILIIAVLLTIWGIVLFQQAGLVGGCVATILVGTVLGHPFFHVSVVTFDRVLLGLLLITYLVQLFCAQIPPRRMGRSDVVLIAFLALLGFSTLTHPWQVDGGQPVSRFLFFFLLPAVLFGIASSAPQSERSYFWMLGSFMVLGSYLALTGAAEVMNWNGLVFPRHIMTSDDIQFLGRARGPLLNPIGNGLLLSVGLASSLLVWPHVSRRFQPVILGLVGLQGMGAILTLTRSVWMGVGLIFLSLATVVVPSRHRGRVVLLAVMLVAGLLLFKGSSFSKFKRDRHVTESDMAESAKLRPILAAFAYEVFQDYPIWGCGFGQYATIKYDYLTKRSFDLPMDRAKTYCQHNVFLALLTETGIVGLGMFATLMVCFVVDAWKVWRDQVRPLWERQQGLLLLLFMAAYLPNAMFHDLSLIPMVNMLWFLLAGIARGALCQKGGTSGQPSLPIVSPSRNVVSWST